MHGCRVVTLCMDIKPPTQARQDLRRRRYMVAEPVEEEAEAEIKPDPAPSAAIWSPPPRDFGMTTTMRWLAMRQTASLDPDIEDSR